MPKQKKTKSTKKTKKSKKTSKQSSLDTGNAESKEIQDAKNSETNMDPIQDTNQTEISDNLEEDSTNGDEKEIKEVFETSNDYIDQKQMEEAESHKLPEKFWHDDIWRILLDPTLVKPEEMMKYDLSTLLSEFTQQMLKEDLIDFRISGMAIYSTAKLHHRKIKDVIDEEEKIQIKELREQAKREIPKAMPQPLRESRKIATSEELYEAMRASIIETMQKREILRRRREERVAKREELKVLKVQGQLPKEILKHIMGKDQTIEEILDMWFEKIRAKIKLNDNDRTSFVEICNDIIDIEEKDEIGKQIKSIQFFNALLFLSTNGRIIINQDSDFDDIIIEIPRYII